MTGSVSVAAVDYATGASPAPDELVELYGAVGWSAYADDPATLEAAIRGSAVNWWDAYSTLLQRCAKRCC